MAMKVFVALLFVCGSLGATPDAATAYGKITEGLIDLRKQFPTAQAKVYVLLDQVEKLYNIAKSSSGECVTLRKRLQDAQGETKQQLETVKKTFEQAKADLAKRFDEQQQRLTAAEKQRDQLMAKASSKPELQPSSKLAGIEELKAA